MRLCQFEGCNSNDRVQNHHIIKGRGKRKQCETPESQIDLCWEHHHGTYGVHGREGHALDTKLRRDLQAKYYAQGRSEDEIRRLMGGKLMLDDSGEIYKGETENV